ncbi:MAG: hypothetical protein E7159_01830 [Firmicutes bacterium]|jgi:5'(3')-deoxyribonucleotidase|nr:hypothetical protein [Bacillota bacterium]
MKKILIDVDEVICNTTFLYYMNEFLGTDYKLDDFKTYYIDDVIPDEKKEDFYNFYISHDIYEKAELIDGSLEGLEKLTHDYDVYLYSSCIMFNKEKESGKLFMDKYNFIMNKLPFIKPENVIFTNTKNMIVGDIQIDDRLKNLMGPTDTKILFTAYHNKDITEEELKEKNVIRANNWKELVDIIYSI